MRSSTPARGRGTRRPPCLLIDLPLTFVGDTLALPYVLCRNAHKDSPADARPKPAPVGQEMYADPPAK